MDKKRAEVALQRVCHQLGFRPLPVRWVRNYQEMTKVTEWPPYRAALGAIRGGPPLVNDPNDRLYAFLNPQDWAMATATTFAFATSATSFTTTARRPFDI